VNEKDVRKMTECPNCNSENIKVLFDDDCFCLDCDWDNLPIIQAESSKDYVDYIICVDVSDSFNVRASRLWGNFIVDASRNRPRQGNMMAYLE
jgi:hypothetical protein